MEIKNQRRCCLILLIFLFKDKLFTTILLDLQMNNVCFHKFSLGEGDPNKTALDCTLGKSVGVFIS